MNGNHRGLPEIAKLNTTAITLLYSTVVSTAMGPLLAGSEMSSMQLAWRVYYWFYKSVELTWLLKQCIHKIILFERYWSR